MSHAAKKLNALVDRLETSRTALYAKLETAREAAAITLPEPFDDEAARRTLAEAVTADALDGTDTAATLRKDQERERTAAAKAIATATAKRDAARGEVDDIIRELFELEAQVEEARRLLNAELAREGEKVYAEAQVEYAAAVSTLAQARAKLAAAFALVDAEVGENGHGFALANFSVLSAHCKVEPAGAVDDERGRFFFNAKFMTEAARAHYERLRADICGEGRSFFGRKAA
jgi:hypothetical protein